MATQFNAGALTNQPFLEDDGATGVPIVAGDVAAQIGSACAKNIINTGVAELEAAGRSIKDELDRWTTIDARDLGLKVATSYDDDSAKTQNSILLNQYLESLNQDDHTEIDFIPGAWWFDDTIRGPRNDGGLWLRGFGGVGGTYPESHHVASSHDLAPWAGAKTRFCWGGPVGANGLAFIDLRGRGQSVSDIQLQGAPSISSGNLLAHRDRDCRVVGPLVGIYISDDWTGHGTGYNMVHRVTAVHCQIGIQLGSRKTTRLTQASQFGASVVNYPDHNYHNGAIVSFEEYDGTLPSSLQPDKNYWVVNCNRDTFQLAPFDVGNKVMPQTDDPDYLTNIVAFSSDGADGRIEITRTKEDDPPNIHYSNSDQFHGDALCFDRCYEGIKIYNGNSIGNVVQKCWWNHTRFAITCYSGDMRVVHADCNGHFPLDGSTVDETFTFFETRHDGYSGRAQSCGLLCDWIRIDGAQGIYGDESLLLVDSFNALAPSGEIGRFKFPVTFGEVVRSNDHLYPLKKFARVDGSIALTINKIRGLTQDHFVVKKGIFVDPTPGDDYGGDADWTATIRVNNADVNKLPSGGVSANMADEWISDVESQSGANPLVQWRSCATLAGDPINDGSEKHLVP
ncbi:MAG: hypothetical protein AAF961_01625 [Planctomycetota bacterium]